MAIVRYAMMMSLDGYVAGLEGGPGLPVPDAALHQHFNELVDASSLQVYGRKMYEVMSYWDQDMPDAHPVEAAFARIWRKTPKLVASTTLNEVGPNARLIGSGIEAEIGRLKSVDAGPIDVSGPTLAASLARANLIDEFRLYQLPVVLGGGKPYFAKGLGLELDHSSTDTMPGGIVLTTYRPSGRS